MLAALVLIGLGLLAAEDVGPPPLDQQLLKEPPADLARAARRDGDARRGALLFHQAALNCARCHAVAGLGNAVGPDLTKPAEPKGEDAVVESILAPSKAIAKGFETAVIAATDGRTLSGIKAEEHPNSVVLRGADGARVEVPRGEIEAMRTAPESLMPAGLVNVLGSRAAFLDLLRYVLEIGDGGPARALALRPDPALLVPPPLPAYEKEIDHAGLISGLDDAAFGRGRAIYERLCIHCHGDRDRAGSLPTALRFASGAFRNGGDPYRMYRTLTDGFGQMAPQGWMVPRQKYDVIHYIREQFVRPHNPSQYAPAGADYLAALPKGASRGPEPRTIEPWATADYGPTLMATYEAGRDGSNFAYKGIAVRLDPGPGGIARGRQWAVYDHDTMRLAAWWGGPGFIDWNGINFNGQHGIHPRLAGAVAVANPGGPGWAGPDGSFRDPRPPARDGRRYGPLPEDWIHYRGLYHHADRAVISYTVGGAEVLESPGLEMAGETPVLVRTLNIGPRERDLVLQAAHADGKERERIAAGVSPQMPLEWSPEGDLRLTIAAGTEPIRLAVRLALADDDSRRAAAIPSNPAVEDLSTLTHGGPPRRALTLKSRVQPGEESGPFAVDVLGLPEPNPWAAPLRLTGLDFLDGGRRAAACTWDGDVWTVDGLRDPSGELTWRRIASGLFQPLGLKVVDGHIFIACRDQIAELRDLDGDGEADFIASFNSDHQVTEHFHEFAMDLQADAQGRFLYAKAARHGLPAVVPQHGTLLRVGQDGRGTEILAHGFRAPNGVCVNADGTFFLTDQEGFWTPKNRIDWVKPGEFHGNLWGYTDVTDPSDDAMVQPICWITNAFDRSPSEIVRVTPPGWGPLAGGLLNLSYGYGKVFLVLTERIGDAMQGGMVALPIGPLPTGLIRGRFHPEDGSLYACGLVAWASSQAQPGGFYRIRPTGKPLGLPVGLHARRGRIELTFSGPLDPDLAADASRYALTTWGLVRSVNYGSKHVDERPLAVRGAALSDDGRTVTLDLPELKPTRGMEIRYDLRARDGTPVSGTIHNTIHQLPD